MKLNINFLKLNCTRLKLNFSSMVLNFTTLKMKLISLKLTHKGYIVDNIITFWFASIKPRLPFLCFLLSENCRFFGSDHSFGGLLEKQNIFSRVKYLLFLPLFQIRNFVTGKTYSIVQNISSFCCRWFRSEFLFTSETAEPKIDKQRQYELCAMCLEQNKRQSGHEGTVHELLSNRSKLSGKPAQTDQAKDRNGKKTNHENQTRDNPDTRPLQIEDKNTYTKTILKSLRLGKRSPLITPSCLKRDQITNNGAPLFVKPSDRESGRHPSLLTKRR